MQDVRVSIQCAGPTLFEPETERFEPETLNFQRNSTTLCSVTFTNSPCNCRHGWPKGSTVHQGLLIFDDLVDFVSWCHHSGRLRWSEAVAIIAMLLVSSYHRKWKTTFKYKWISFIELTENIDKGIGQEVAVVIGDITLVDSAGTSLHISEYDGVVLHLSAQIFWSICSQTKLLLVGQNRYLYIFTNI